jgi:hypothetical protein
MAEGYELCSSPFYQLPDRRATDRRPLRYNDQMQINEIIAALDSEIATLQQVRALLSGSTTNGDSPSARTKPHLSAEARARIAAAQRKRWAKVKKAIK